MSNGRSAARNTKTLPLNSNLEHIKGQAKVLHKSLQDGDESARSRVNSFFDNISNLTLTQVQLVIAREYGFASWDAMRKEINSDDHTGHILKNRFVLEQKVGSGGLGDVYRALDLRQQEAEEPNPYIAIKFLVKDFTDDFSAMHDGLKRNILQTRGLSHPNILGVYSLDHDGDVTYITMELLDGMPLDDYLREHSVSEEEAWSIIDGVCQGLIAAHDANILHSDFKPGSIYYTADRIAKVFDFGIAQEVAASFSAQDHHRLSPDAQSLVSLSPAYASYEAINGHVSSSQDDVFSLAVVAYELLSGKHPFNRTPADKALADGLEPAMISSISASRWHALKQALALESKNRTMSVSGFHAAMFGEN